jgi:class 3 adenylate cyclase
VAAARAAKSSILLVLLAVVKVRLLAWERLELLTLAAAQVVHSALRVLIRVQSVVQVTQELRIGVNCGKTLRIH